ncbi:hypothetical protein TPHA_0D02900 [Tetrapisispora phaffii CBS 4417]|uniref:BZIP domain-containing protein n=1 Tax=Tetrapisispora phaffii (strain ATCC 24235 / CBS 4417 / NBRC 1672 / NRRL Y-8282 / UCD 70-5) TaxID=1071381 RepID=G8BSV5_TETPH|nr:hypothetical protein TPHA_0D02900 [Tetrapisispora phaffii CBS 4417]CCE62926.1 hypothetical protein TPHA_0D02900 [Tetrapisispora phaffii CBS 4417]
MNYSYMHLPQQHFVQNEQFGGSDMTKAHYMQNNYRNGNNTSITYKPAATETNMDMPPSIVNAVYNSPSGGSIDGARNGNINSNDIRTSIETASVNIEQKTTNSRNTNEICGLNTPAVRLSQFPKHLTNHNTFEYTYNNVQNGQPTYTNTGYQDCNATTIKLGLPTITASTDSSNTMVLSNYYRGTSSTHIPTQLTSYSLQNKSVKRAIQNRNAQKAFRQRKKKYIQELESKASKYDNLVIENNNLKIQIKELTSLIRSLK